MADRNHIYLPSKIINDSFISRLGLTPKQLVDIIQDIPFQQARPEAIAFKLDQPIDRPLAIEKHMKMLVDFVCIMYYNLKFLPGKQTAVFCVNGRSRSPCGILAYYMMVGNIPKDKAKQCLKQAFNQQRTTASKTTGEFPNFNKFNQLISQLAIDIDSDKPWLRTRINETFALLKVGRKMGNMQAGEFYNIIMGHPKNFTQSSSSDSSTRTTTRTTTRISKLLSTSTVNGSSNGDDGKFLHPTSWIKDLSNSIVESSRNRKRSSTVQDTTKLLFEDFIVGRRIIGWYEYKNRKGQSRWYTGTISVKSGGYFTVVYDDGTVLQDEQKNQPIVAFRSGTRVKVHFNQSRVPEKKQKTREHIFKKRMHRSGTIIQLHGSLEYVVRMDNDGRIYRVHGRDLTLLDRDQPLDHMISHGPRWYDGPNAMTSEEKEDVIERRNNEIENGEKQRQCYKKKKVKKSKKITSSSSSSSSSSSLSEGHSKMANESRIKEMSLLFPPGWEIKQQGTKNTGHYFYISPEGTKFTNKNKALSSVPLQTPASPSAPPSVPSSVPPSVPPSSSPSSPPSASSSSSSSTKSDLLPPCNCSKLESDKVQQERKDLKRDYARLHDSMQDKLQEIQNEKEALIKQRDSSAAVDAMKKAFETLQKENEDLKQENEDLKQSQKKRKKTNGNGNGGGGRGGRSTSSTSSSSTSFAAEPPSKKRKTTTTNVEKRQGKRGAVAAAVEMAGTVHATLPSHRVANSVNDDMYFNSKFVQSHIIHALLLNYGWSIREAKSRNRSGVMYEYSTGSDCNSRFVFSDKFRADIVKWAKNNASHVYEEAAKEANVWVYWKQEDAYYACTIKDVIVKTTEGIETTKSEKLTKWNVRFHSDASSSKDIIDSEINSFDGSRDTVINAVPIFTYEKLENLIQIKLSLNV